MNLKIQKFNKHTLNKSPQAPGIYIFRNKENEPIYIGKSKNLKKRVYSYFLKNLSVKTLRMLKECLSFSIVLVTSELEALLLEAYLVKKYKPSFNFSLKDDKHPLYIRISKEKYPRVLTARKIDLTTQASETEKNLSFYGPFPSSSNVKNVLKMIRKIFPFSDHRLGKRGCLYSQIGLCNPCPNEIEKLKDVELKKTQRKKYLKNIRLIKRFLDGKIQSVQNTLRKSMKSYAEKEMFEEAAELRKQIEKIDYITQPITPIEYFLTNPNLIEDIRKKEIDELSKLLSLDLNGLKSLKRIECYDVAHLTGTNPTAAMATFINGDPEKTLYRHFKIRQKKGKSDIDSLREVAKRRTKYLSSWGIPNLIIVDGGKAQVGVIREIFEEYQIPVVGLAKRYETLVIPIKRSDLAIASFIERRVPEGPAKNLLQRIRNEAHRFARRYHYNLLRRELIPT